MTTREKKTCVLCGYPTADYIVHPVPLARPPQTHVVCLDCAEEIHSLVLEMNKAEEAVQKAAEWIRTPEGQKAVQEGLERAKRLADEFKKAERVDPALWDREVCQWQ